MTELLYPYISEEQWKRENRHTGKHGKKMVSDRKRKADERTESERDQRRAWLESLKKY